MASEKQVRYALHLLREAGYSTKYMDARYKDFGATMRERSGLVEDWLADHASDVIDNLKGSRHDDRN